MRRIGAITLVLGTGCSVIFDMGDYDRGAVADARPSSSSSSGEPSGRLPDGGSATVDAAEERAEPLPCTRESEPNDAVSGANAFMPGRTCGALSSVSDVDVFAFSTPASVEVTFTLPNDAKCEVFEGGASSPALSFTGAGGTATVGPGDFVIRLSHAGASGPPLEYELAR